MLSPFTLLWDMVLHKCLLDEFNVYKCLMHFSLGKENLVLLILHPGSLALLSELISLTYEDKSIIEIDEKYKQTIGVGL